MDFLDQKLKMILLLWFGIFGLACGTDTAPWNVGGECITDPRCPSFDNPSYSVFLPHSTDCSRFYHCGHGKACEWACPSGLHWSTSLNRCEWPNVACCDASAGCNSLSPTTSATTTTTTTTVATPGNTPSNPTQCGDDARCPLNDNQPRHLAHETDCGLFYSCSYGKRCPWKCPAGQHFGVHLQRCDWPQLACCDPTIPCQQQPTTAVVPTNLPSTDCRPDSRCPLADDLLKPLLLPVPGNCGAFYKCRIGDACLLSCPSGQHFSQTLQVCEWPSVACCDPSTPCT